MKLSEADRTADKEIAEIVNKLESLQFLEPNDDTDTQITNSVSELEQLFRQYPMRGRSYISEIYNSFKGIIELYKEHEKPLPYINPKFLPLNCLDFGPPHN